MTDSPRLLDLFSQLVTDDPSAVVLYDGFAGTREPREVTRIQLHSQAATIADDLRSHGIGEGDCIGVWLPNWSTSVAAQLAALSVGAHVVGMNTRYNSAEVANVLARGRPRIVLVASGFHRLNLADTLCRALRSCRAEPPLVMVVPGPATEGVDDLSPYDVGAGAVPLPPSAEVGDLRPHPTRQLSTAFATSGSTGRSKIVAHDEEGVTRHALAVAGRLRLTPADTVLAALPISGVFGFAPLMAAVVAGSRTLLEPVFDGPGVLEDMVVCGVTHAAAADDLFGRLAAAWATHRPRLTLKWIGIADFEGRSRELARLFESEFGSTVVGVYGSSELFALASTWSEEFPPEQRWSGGGRLVLHDSRVRVVDPDTGAELPDGQDGELQFRGCNVANAYLGDPDGYPGAFTQDGWFRTGDLGRRLSADTIHFVCRIGDVLRLGGFLVDPSEIEARLVEHPSVGIAKVVGTRGPGGGTVAVGFVVPSGGRHPNGEELRSWCAEALARYKVPSAIFHIDSLPTTSGVNGAKVRTQVLRDMAARRMLEDR